MRCRRPALPKYTALQKRKGLRMAILGVILTVEVWFVVFCATRKFESTPVQVPLTEPIEFEVTNCKLHITVASIGITSKWFSNQYTPMVDHATVWYEMAVPLKPIWNMLLWETSAITSRGDKGHKFTLENHIDEGAHGEERTEACIVRLLLHDTSALASLDITCKDHCIVTTEREQGFDSGPYWSVANLRVDTTGVVNVSSPVRLQEAQIGSLDIHLATGDVYLEQVTITGASNISTAKGNVYAQFRNDVTVVWSSSTNLYCFAAPSQPQVLTDGECNKTYVGDPNTTIAHPESNDTNESAKNANESADPMIELAANMSGLLSDPSGFVSDSTLAHRCNGVADLCSSSTCRTDTTVPMLNLSIPAGSFYVTKRERFDQQVKTHPGVGFSPNPERPGSYAISFDGMTYLKLAKAKALLSDAARTDILFTIEGPPLVRQARPSNGYLYTITPSVAYAQIGPWWLAFLSMGLLVKNVKTLSIDLRTAPCPYSPYLDLDSAGDIWKVVHDAIVPTNDHIVAYIKPMGTPIGEKSNWPFYPMALDLTTFFALQEEWVSMIRTGSGHFEKEIVSLTQSGTLIAALVISMVVSVLLSIILQYIVWQLISTGVLILSDYGSHIRRYEEVTAAHSPQTTNTEGIGGQALEKFKAGVNVTVAMSRMKKDDEEDEKTNEKDMSLFSKLGLKRNDTKADTAGPNDSTATGNSTVAATASSGGGQPHRASAQQQQQQTHQQKDQSAVKYFLGHMEMIPLSRMPPMFSLIDHAILVLQKSYLGNSLDDFLSQPGVIREATEIEDATSTPPPTLTRFKDVYSKYCFLLKKEEHHLRSKECVEKIEKKGFKVQALGPLETPDAFICIRFKTERELDREDQTVGAQGRARLPGETSLDFFLRDQCKITRFEQDKILVDEFKAKYVQFCLKHRMSDPIIVSKALMAQKKITTSKIDTFKIVPIVIPLPGEMETKVKILDINEAESQNKKIMKEHDHTGEDDYLPLWWLIDTLTVLAHVVVVALVAFFPIPLAACFNVAAVYSPFSVKQSEMLFSAANMLVQPSRVLWQVFAQFPYFFIHIAVSGIMSTIVGTIELIIYYSEDEFLFRHDLLINDEKTTASHNQRRGCGWRFRRWVHMYQWVNLTVVILITTFLLAQMCVWCILGAMINPNAFLAYATMVMTSIAFAGAKWVQMRNLFNTSFDEIVQSTQSVVNDAINRTLKTLIDFSGAEFSGIVEGLTDGLHEAVAGIGDVTGGVFQQQVMRLSGGGLGKNIMSAGFDISTVVGVATGKVSALEAFAEHSNVPVEMVHLVNALADGSCEATVKAICELLGNNLPNNPVAPELVAALAELAFHPTRAKVEKCVKALYRHALPAMIMLWLQQAGPLLGRAVSNTVESHGGLPEAASILMKRLVSEGLTDDEQALLKAKAIDTILKAMSEHPELLEAVLATESATFGAGLHQLLRDSALEILPAMLKGYSEVERMAAELPMVEASAKAHA